MNKQINHDVVRTNHDIVLAWGDAFSAPIEWDENDMPSIDPTFLKERGW